MLTHLKTKGSRKGVKHKMRKLIAGLGILVFAFVFTGAAEAAVIKNIFDSSAGTSVAAWLIKVKMLNSNGTDINNNSVTSTANSGANVVASADDQSGTVMNTGATDASTGVSNTANTNVLSENYESADGVDNTIDNVDDSSAGTATSSDTLDNEMTNSNAVVVDNAVDAKANSGTNVNTSGDSLTGSGVTTGASSAETLLDNFFNSNLKEVVRRIKGGAPFPTP